MLTSIQSVANNPPEYLDYESSIKKLESLLAQDIFRIDINQKKHKLTGVDETLNQLFSFRLPLPMPQMPENSEELSAYVEELDEDPPDYIIMLIQAGAAALGFCEFGDIVLHKAFKKYMKRHKRGKSQITYLKTRGKSKAGSRIRLANTIRFFEEINERLQDWEDFSKSERIMYSCTPNLWGMLFQSNVEPPFEKEDDRLVKIPIDVNVPSYEELVRVNRLVNQGIYIEF